MKCRLTLLILAFSPFFQAASADYSDEIKFYGINGNGEKFVSTSELGSTAQWCDVNGKFAIITHGWLENCSHYTMAALMDRLQTVRGGCILCMDYGYYAITLNYFGLVANYPGIQSVLTGKLRQLRDEGFEPANGYMYGFSYGAHLVINSARSVFGNRNFGMIDVCDPAGALFDGTSRITSDASQAAQNVQCIHTSTNLGTSTRTCTQNWLMGSCGVYQPASTVWATSHLSCPIFYLNAFTYYFPAINRPWYCAKTSRSLASWPPGYRMGYDDDRLMPNSQPFGTLYACTSERFPYNCGR